VLSIRRKSASKAQNEGGCEECVEYLFNDLYSEE
jgi:hypothetical protein